MGIILKFSHYCSLLWYSIYFRAPLPNSFANIVSLIVVMRVRMGMSKESERCFKRNIKTLLEITNDNGWTNAITYVSDTVLQPHFNRTFLAYCRGKFLLKSLLGFCRNRFLRTSKQPFYCHRWASRKRTSKRHWIFCRKCVSFRSCAFNTRTKLRVGCQHRKISIFDFLHYLWEIIKAVGKWSSFCSEIELKRHRGFRHGS